MKLEYKRRAIYTVLSEVISDKKLLDVMWHWQNIYSHKSGFELNHFLSDCKNIPEIARSRSELYRKIIALLVTKKTGIDEDPWPLMLAYRQDKFKSLPSSDRDNWSEIFTTVMTELFSRLCSDTQRSVSHYVIQRIPEIALPQPLAHSFYAWTDQGNIINTHGADHTQLKRLLNLTYTGICEHQGPVNADQFLSDAIKLATSVHKSGTIDPRLLL
ncbi:MAG: hypothetical protein ACJA0E_001670 [Bermanella sp.]|jgi:hypothetical protein